MKKFYTCMGQQELHLQYYGDESGKLYSSCQEQIYSSVIVTMLENIHNEPFKVIVLDSMNTDKSKKNIELLKNELQHYFKDQYELEILVCLGLETSSGQLKIFKDIYSTIEEGDEIYFDITFGYRPTPMLAMAACNYGYKFIDDVKIKKIFYTLFTFNAPANHIHQIIDCTTIFKINQFMETAPAIPNSSMNDLLSKLFIKDA